MLDYEFVANSGKESNGLSPSQIRNLEIRFLLIVGELAECSKSI